MAFPEKAHVTGWRKVHLAAPVNQVSGCLHTCGYSVQDDIRNSHRLEYASHANPSLLYGSRCCWGEAQLHSSEQYTLRSHHPLLHADIPHEDGSKGKNRIRTRTALYGVYGVSSAKLVSRRPSSPAIFYIVCTMYPVLYSHDYSIISIRYRYKCGKVQQRGVVDAVI